ncbi:MAG: HAMP domain-containing histidine kinase [Lentimicrobiaceae bacterium]|jgi:signal transduction histidine kinase|nr:HAMP domain-containing histidine kinase [Lentimicrobiaceae bacterium]
MHIKKRLVFITILTFLGFLMFDFYLKQQQKPDAIVRKMETKLTKSMQKLRQQATLFATYNDLDFVDLMANNEIDDEKQAFVLVYENDTLKYWNSNRIIPSEKQLQAIENGEQTVLFIRNGLYLSFFAEARQPDQKIFLFQLLYSDYPFENNFLENKLNDAVFGSNQNLELSDDTTTVYLVRNESGKALFSVIIDENETQINQQLIVFLLFVFIVFLTFLYVLLYRILRSILFFRKRPYLSFLVWAVLVCLVRFIFSKVDLNLFLFSSDLFESTFLGSEFSYFNFGALILNAHLLLLLTIEFKKNLHKTNKISNIWLRALLLVVVFTFAYRYFIFFTSNLIFHTNLQFSFTEFFGFNLLSSCAFLLLIVYTISSFIFLQKTVSLLMKPTDSVWKLFVVFVVCFVFSNIVFDFKPTLFIIGIVLFVVMILFEKKKIIKTYSVFFLIFMVLYAFLLTNLFYSINETKSDNEQILTTFNLALESDPMFEFIYEPIPSQLETDSVLKNLIFSNEEAVEEIFLNHFNNDYFDKAFSRYSITATLCRPEETLKIQPNNYLIDCDLYFHNVLNAASTIPITPNLYYIDDARVGPYYISPIHFSDSVNGQTVEANLYIEFYYKFIPQGLGFPELLTDKRRDSYASNFSILSFAIYQNDVLNYKFGNYLYPNFVEDSIAFGTFFERDGFRHYQHKINDLKIIATSRPTQSFIDIIAPFSYFLILLIIVGALVIGLVFYQKPLWFSQFNFRIKLQAIVLIALGLTFALIGPTSIIFIQNVYDQRTNDFIAERTRSALIEVEQNFNKETFDDDNFALYMNELLKRLSIVFFSDINFYDSDGKLLAYSSSDIFDFGLRSDRMNPAAYYKMNVEKKLYFIHKEHIGESVFYSAYHPFFDHDGNTIAYLNIPYFTKQTELQEETSNLLLAYVSLFVLLIGISTLMAILLSRRITMPLLMIQEKMKNVRLGKQNESITYSGKDEIGQLVKQYNHLLAELEKSAGLLARSERETAWREMARQVAHEIKNPLTPMRLSVQYLQRSWNDGDPDIDQKIKRTTTILIEQIDTLASIASAFSDFEKMPVNEPESFDLIALLQQTADLYNEQANIAINIHFDSKTAHYFTSDKKNIGRAFGNIIKNAVQAIGQQKNGKIDISVQEFPEKFVIAFADNGTGIDEVEQRKIFSPNFTTKSSGMGIGLSIVYSIVQSVSGKIWFESEKNKGTTFFIELYRQKLG